MTEAGERKPIFKQGHMFHGPNGEAYRMTRAVYYGDETHAKDFEALWGAPRPVDGEPMPDWLCVQINPENWRA